MRLRTRAFILAAGMSKRLGELTSERPEILLKLDENTTFLDYHIAILTRYGKVGPGDIYVVAGYAIEKVAQKAELLGIGLLENEFFDKYENMYSLYVTGKAVHDDLDKIIVLNGDTLIHPGILEMMCEQMEEVRKSIKNFGLFAIDVGKGLSEEEMKVIANSRGIIRFGKDILSVEALGEYIGLSIFDQEGYRTYLRALEEHVERGITNVWYELVLNVIVDKIRLIPIDIDSFPWIEVDTPQDYETAKKLYRSELKGAIE